MIIGPHTPHERGVYAIVDSVVTHLIACSRDGGASTIRLSLSRARLRRDITVPTGTPRRVAISL